jgi:predicted aconitase
MRLTDEESAMLAGERGEPRRWAIAHQIAVGEFFDAADFVAVSQAHIMADTESLGEAGIRFLEALAAAPEAERRVQVPTITDPRGIDFAVYRRLGQTQEMAALETRAITALRAFGVLMTDTCINYQTIMAPIRGDHLAYGDTGVVIYSNSVLGARSNFEGGPSALAAALTGRAPRYGYHLDACRRATRRFRLTATPRDLSAWGALGGIVGAVCGSYWEVPVIEGVAEIPGSDALKRSRPRARDLFPPEPQARGAGLCRPHPRPRYRERWCRHRLDAARHGGARHRPAGAGLQPGQPDRRARSRLWRRRAGRPL